MKKFCIVKRAPGPGKKSCQGTDNVVYSREEAIEKAQHLASIQNACFVVMEVIAAYVPTAPPVEELELED